MVQIMARQPFVNAVVKKHIENSIATQSARRKQWRRGPCRCRISAAIRVRLSSTPVSPAPVPRIGAVPCIWRGMH